MLSPLASVLVIGLTAMIVLPFIYWRQLLAPVMRFVLEPIGKFIMANLMSFAILTGIFIVSWVIINWDVVIFIIEEAINTMIIIIFTTLIAFGINMFRSSRSNSTTFEVEGKRK
jgi:hypothetical protein